MPQPWIPDLNCQSSVLDQNGVKSGHELLATRIATDADDTSVHEGEASDAGRETEFARS